jgi:transposase-like protein
MPKSYSAEFYLRAVALVRAGKTITQTSYALVVSAGALHKWVTKPWGRSVARSRPRSLQHELN